MTALIIPYRRDVMLNLRLIGTEAAAAGAETHVCELQMVLRPFHELRCARPPQAAG
jgi:hypothetical protein